MVVTSTVRARSIITACVAGFTLVACTTSTASPSESVPESTAPTMGAAECSPIDLRTQDGNRIDLTGIWRSFGATHYVRQDGNCVWWVAIEDDPDLEQVSQLVVVFRGELSSDFTLSGEWMSVMRPALISGSLHGPITFEIGLEDPEAVVLRSTAPFGPYEGVTMNFIGPLPRGIEPGGS